MRVIHVLRKPLSEGTVATNVLQHAAGGINIDQTRVAAPGEEITTHTQKSGEDGCASNAVYGDYKGGFTTHQTEGQKLGRWPGNLILQHLDGCRCDGVKKVKGNRTDTRPDGDGGRADKSQWRFRPTDQTKRGFSDEDGKESVANWVCEDGCPVRALDEQSGTLTSGVMVGQQRGWGKHGIYGTSGDTQATSYGDAGGASRFFKQVGGGGDG